MALCTRVVIVSILSFLLFEAVSTRPCAADDQKQAKAKLMKGRELIEQENYLGALAAFTESYKLMPKMSVLYNIGMCYKALFRYVEAINTFKECVQKAGNREDIRERSRAAISELEQLVCKMEIRGAPSGATVLLNGKKAAKTPLQEPIIIDPGQHNVWVGKKGYKTMRTEVTAVSGAVIKVRAALRKSGAQIKVECAEENAVVRIDGEVAGGCPYKGDIEPGTHVIRVEAPKKKSFVKEMDIGPGGKAAVTVSELADVRPDELKLPLLISGVATTVVGLGVLGGVGGYFTHRYNSDHDKLSELGDEAKKSCTSISSCQPATAYNNLAKNRIPKDEKGMVVGYVLGGTVALTGAILLVIWAVTHETKDKVAISSTRGGMAVKF